MSVSFINFFNLLINNDDGMIKLGGNFEISKGGHPVHESNDFTY